MIETRDTCDKSAICVPHQTEVYSYDLGPFLTRPRYKVAIEEDLYPRLRAMQAVSLTSWTVSDVVEV
jgi:hypothetical protein